MDYRLPSRKATAHFSVNRATVIHYIDTQAEHHRKWSFEQEFMTLLEKSGAEYDAQFVFG